MTKRRQKALRVRSMKVPKSACPGCRAPLEGVTSTARPKPGDISLCVYCFVFLRFTDTLRSRLLTDAEWLALDPEHRAVLTRLREHMKIDDPGRPYRESH